MGAMITPRASSLSQNRNRTLTIMDKGVIDDFCHTTTTNECTKLDETNTLIVKNFSKLQDSLLYIYLSFRKKITTISKCTYYKKKINTSPLCIVCRQTPQITLLLTFTLVRTWYEESSQCLGRFLGIISPYPSVPKSNRSDVDIFHFSFIKSGYILQTPPKRSVSLLQS